MAARHAGRSWDVIQKTGRNAIATTSPTWRDSMAKPIDAVARRMSRQRPVRSAVPQAAAASTIMSWNGTSVMNVKRRGVTKGLRTVAKAPTAPRNLE